MNVTICKDAVRNLSRFRAHNYLKKVALELVARSLDLEQIRKLEKCFNAVRFRRYDATLGPRISNRVVCRA